MLNKTEPTVGQKDQGTLEGFRHSSFQTAVALGLCICVLSHFSLVQLFATLWTVVPQDPLSMGFSRQEHWSGLPCPSPGDLPDPGIEPTSPVPLALQADSSPLSHREAQHWVLTAPSPRQTGHTVLTPGLSLFHTVLPVPMGTGHTADLFSPAL